MGPVVPSPSFIRDRTCHLSGTVPIIYWDSTCHLSYTGQYLQFLWYHAHYLRGTVPAIFVVPCPLFTWDGTCNFLRYPAQYFSGIGPVVPSPSFFWDNTCHLSGTVPIIFLGRYLPFKRYLAHYLCHTSYPGSTLLLKYHYNITGACYLC